MSVRVLKIINGSNDVVTLYLPEGWDADVRMGNPSDSFGMTYEHQTGRVWLDEHGTEWLEVRL